MGAVTSSVAAKLAFFPPTPPSYSLEPDDATGAIAFAGKKRRDDVEMVKVGTTRGTQVVAMHVRNPAANLTVLYSHGNAADLGQLYELFVELSVHLGVNVMGYDYSGYGLSSGKPSESNTYADIEAVYRCLEEKYGTREEDVILYGQSVGSGPTLELATHLPHLRAVVLHSPILSGLRVLYPVKYSYWFDIYKNIEKIPLVECPVLIMHGTIDDTVDCSHGKKLYDLCKQKYDPLWLEGANHCDLELFPLYIKHLKRFIIAMEKSTSRSKPSTSENANLSDLHSSDCTELLRNSTDQRGMDRTSTGCKEKSRKSADSREKSRISTEKKEKSRKSVDHHEKARTSTEQLYEKGRQSNDRFSGMMRSVALCNIGCFNHTPAIA